MLDGCQHLYLFYVGRKDTPNFISRTKKLKSQNKIFKIIKLVLFVNEAFPKNVSRFLETIVGYSTRDPQRVKFFFIYQT